MQDWSCYFETSSCSSPERLAGAWHIDSLARVQVAADRQVDMFWDMGSDFSFARHYPDAYVPMLPLLMSQYHLGIMESWGALLDNLLHMHDWVSAMVSAAMIPNASFAQPVAGVHIRSGEFVRDSRRIAPDARYIDALDVIFRHLHFPSVFIATDAPSKSATHMNQQFAGKPYVFYSAHRMLVEEGVAVVDVFQSARQDNASSVVAEALADMFQLASCDSFVGVRSNWAAIAAGLLRFRNASAPVCFIKNEGQTAPNFPVVCDFPLVCEAARDESVFLDFHTLGYPHEDMHEVFMLYPQQV
jgi:hypothetical protein